MYSSHGVISYESVTRHPVCTFNLDLGTILRRADVDHKEAGGRLAKAGHERLELFGSTQPFLPKHVEKPSFIKVYRDPER